MELVKAVFNGKFDNLENIQVSPLSRAYTFSDSIYEVIPFQNNSFICFEEIGFINSKSGALVPNGNIFDGVNDI